MNRITERHLQHLCDCINRETGSPDKPYIDGVGQIGNYHLSHAYGGVCLHRMSNEGGGVNTPLNGGHVPKRELYNQMRALLRGIETAKELARENAVA